MGTIIGVGNAIGIQQGLKLPPSNIPEGAIQTYATEKYLQTKSGKYITIKEE